MSRVSFLPVAAVGILGWSSVAQADVIDFSQFTASLTTVSSLSGVTEDGIGFDITGGAFQTFVQGTNWAGNFQLGDNVVFNSATSATGTVITFDSVISSLSNIAVQANAYGNYTALIQAFDISGNLLGSQTYSATSSNTPGTVPSFNLAYAGIKSVSLSTPVGGALGYGIGNSFTPVSGAVPEPASWAMMIFGFAMAGAAMRRRSVYRTVSFS